MDYLTFIIGIAVLFLVLKILSLPMKIIIRFVINAVIGGIIYYVLGLMGIGLTITWVSALIVGILGVPGVIIVAIMQLLLQIVI